MAAAGNPVGSAGKPRERRNREADVIDAAIDVFSRKGFSGASIQDVADRVGVLKGSLYHYIDSKEELLFRIFDESHRQATVIVKETAALDVPPLERLHSYFERYLLWYLHNLERVSLYFSEWRYLTGERRESVIAQRKTYQVFVRGLIQEGQDRGDIASHLDPTYASQFVLGAVNAVPDWYRRRGRDAPEQVALVYADMIVGTVTAEPFARA